MPSHDNARVGAAALIAILAISTPSPAADVAWKNILAPLKLGPEMGGRIILPEETAGLGSDAIRLRLEEGYLVIFIGDSKLSDYFGFVSTGKKSIVRSVIDERAPKLSIVWAEPVDVPVCRMPPGAKVFVKDKWDGTPLMAAVRMGSGAILWLAADPGREGHERFPYLPQTLVDLGATPPVKARDLWLFFDSSYRMRVDPDFMARRWRASGVSALHIAAWHYFEPNDPRDNYLQRLIGACHKNAIHVYAWLELPHVSEQFWEQHPEWREKTATGTDAQLDWRKLMNLRNPDCVKEVRRGVEELLLRFDWDGVNLAELYFESLEGHHNPARFTPMNADIRSEFRKSTGWDPLELWDMGSAHYYTKSASSLLQFLEYRSSLVRGMQEDWVGAVENIRKQQPHLDLVLTHVDNLLEPETKDRIGADAKFVLPLLDRHDMTFLVEDPATAWASGPERYPRIAEKYNSLTKRADRLAIDINVVERYQDVYPTKQQTGIELLREIHLAAAAFRRVTLYFESSIAASDWPVLAHATAVATGLKREAGQTHVQNAREVGLRWQGPAKVDGALWPVSDHGWIWLPPGDHKVEPAANDPPLRILDFNGQLKGASVSAGGLQFSYEAQSRALVVLNKPPKKILIDNEPVEPKYWIFDDNWILVLPRGQHFVSIPAEPGV